jgi:hypothetical protein
MRRNTAVAALADRYFNEQVARLGPIPGGIHALPTPEPKRKRGRPRKQKVEIIR